MKNRLTDDDYSLLLSCIEGIHGCRKLEDFPRHVLAELKKLIPARMICYSELDYARGRSVNLFDPPIEYSPDARDWFNRLIHDHPVLNYFKSTGDGQALKISDFLGVREFHALPLYKEAYKLTGAEDQMGFGVRVRDDFIIGAAFDRAERSFTERDRALINLFRPHIIQAYLHLEELAGNEELQSDLQAALRENGLGVIVLNGANEIAHATPGAFEKLASYIPVPEGPRKLPAGLVSWASGENGGQNGDPFVIRREPSRLIVRRVPRENRLLLLLSEENSAAPAGHLARFKLTPRESEVLRWIAEGKTNAEIATILVLSAGTAKLHVERILAKLGVENRTAAAAMLRNS